MDGVLVLLFKDFMQPANDLPPTFESIIGGAFCGTPDYWARAVDAIDDRFDYVDGYRHQNSILLVDYAIIARRQGMARFEAFGRCLPYKRSRPIVMTTIAMGAGDAIGLGMGADPSFRSPIWRLR